jgi:hypothetical protein
MSFSNLIRLFSLAALIFPLSACNGSFVFLSYNLAQETAIAPLMPPDNPSVQPSIMPPLPLPAASQSPSPFVVESPALPQPTPAFTPFPVVQGSNNGLTGGGGGGGGSNSLGSLTLSAPGTQLAGAVTLTATPQTTRPISEVIFLADDVILGSVSAPPYAYSWDTLTTARGPKNL